MLLMQLMLHSKDGFADLNLKNIPNGLFINGVWEAAKNNPKLVVTNPATGKKLMSIPSALPEDGIRAAEAANAAQPKFAAMTPQERSAILIKAHALLLSSKFELAAIMTAEMGKPFKEACGEIEYSAGYLQWFAQEGLRIQGSQSQSPSGRGQIILSREPVGVSLLITPWNFPLAMGARKIAPAIATGCAVVVKPAERTPLTMMYLARIFQEAGVPDGALNVIATEQSADVIGPILKEGLVRHLSFTGSTAVGSILHSQCSPHLIRTSLELGGNAPFIIFEDVDLDKAVLEITAAKMRNMGEACTAANRILVQESIAAEFAQKLADKFASLKVGDGLHKDTDIGPMIDHRAITGIQSLVDDAYAHGAKALTGGKPIEGNGSFYPPTVLVNVSRNSRIMQEEVFGPVAPIVTFSDEEDAIELANNTKYGLASYLMTENLAQAMRVSRKLEMGMVGINSGIISDVAAPLGGVKASGIGREGGILGIDEFLEYKYTFIPQE